MRNLWRLMGVVFCAAGFALAGCNDNSPPAATAPSTGPSAAEHQKVMIGFVGKANSNPVFQAAHAGARDAEKEFGPKYGIDLEVNIQTPPDEDAAKQAEAIDTLVRLGAKGIAVACSEAKTLTPAIDRAAAAGVPVVCYDSDAPESKRIAYYGTDDQECGQKIMEYLAKEMGEKGTVAILAGNQNAPNLQHRVQAVMEELKKHPGITALASGPVYHEELAAKAAEAVQETQRHNPNITGWAFVGGWPLFTRDALPWKPGEVKVVSADALPPELKYLNDGYVQVLLGQDSYSWGHRSVQILLDKVVKGIDPPSMKIYDPLKIVTKENAVEWSKKWEKWLPQ